MHDATVAKRMADLGADLPAPDQRSPQALAGLVDWTRKKIASRDETLRSRNWFD